MAAVNAEKYEPKFLEWLWVFDGMYGHVFSNLTQVILTIYIITNNYIERYENKDTMILLATKKQHDG